MKSNNLQVTAAPTHEVFSAEVIHFPKLPKDFAHALEQVKPIFAEWTLAEETFEKNTVEVAKAVSRAFDLYKAENEDATKVSFARFFDSSISEDATMRDVASNPTYNRIRYLLNKVATRTESAEPAETRAQRQERRAKQFHRAWTRLLKAGVTQDGARKFAETVLIEFFSKEDVQEILG